MKWYSYTIETTTIAEDLIVAMLDELGIEGAMIENNVPLTKEEIGEMFIDFPAELGEDDGTSRVTFYLDADETTAEEREALLERVMLALEEQKQYADIGAATITAGQTEDIDWMNNWKKFFSSFYLEDILIKPTWEELRPEDEGKVMIEIDPGVSFGTGKHETTQLCIRQIRKYMKAGDRVLDVGCGSGILSIVALKLGAGSVVGTDIDDACLTSTYENFEVNHLTREQGTFYCGNLIDDVQLQETVGGEYDVVVANILADVIIPMAPVLPARMKSGGILITSGIIDFKEKEVAAALEAVGLTIEEINHQGEWVNITARKK
ncbi:MAG: 50S ribosomal protein L11 methyltransferase [Eubacterium sp.]|nr:50S ribosomal protein L11 methyltransferase [Eubacterium sp.]